METIYLTLNIGRDDTWQANTYFNKGVRMLQYMPIEKKQKSQDACKNSLCLFSLIRGNIHYHWSYH